MNSYYDPYFNDTPSISPMIGTVLGTLIVKDIDFHIEQVHKELTNDLLYDRYRRLLTLSEENFLEFSCLIYAKEVGQIWAPPIISHNVMGQFTTTPMLVEQAFTYVNSSLVDDEGYLLNTSITDKLAYFCYDDIFEFVYTMLGLPFIMEMLESLQLSVNNRILDPNTKAIRCQEKRLHI